MHSMIYKREVQACPRRAHTFNSAPRYRGLVGHQLLMASCPCILFTPSRGWTGILRAHGAHQGWIAGMGNRTTLLPVQRDCVDKLKHSYAGVGGTCTARTTRLATRGRSHVPFVLPWIERRNGLCSAAIAYWSTFAHRHPSCVVHVMHLKRMLVLVYSHRAGALAVRHTSASAATLSTCLSALWPVGCVNTPDEPAAACSCGSVHTGRVLQEGDCKVTCGRWCGLARGALFVCTLLFGRPELQGRNAGSTEQCAERQDMCKRQDMSCPSDRTCANRRTRARWDVTRSRALHHVLPCTSVAFGLVISTGESHTSCRV